MIEDEQPDKDVIAIPDTKPQMWLFVPYELALFLGMAFGVIDMQTHSLINGFLVFPFWLMAAVLVRRDVNGVRVLMVNLRHGFLYLDYHRWGGLSPTPWPRDARMDDRRDAL